MVRMVGGCDFTQPAICTYLTYLTFNTYLTFV